MPAHRPEPSNGVALGAYPFARAAPGDDPQIEDGLAHDERGGERVRFVDEAAVLSDMPTSAGGSAGQQSRWEAGKAALVRRWTPRLVAAGLRDRDPVRVHAGLELLVPPQSLLAGATVAGGGAALALGPPAPRRLACAMALAQAAFVAGGMRRAGAPRAAWRGLALAPALVVRKAILYLRIVAGRGPREWVRTERDAV